MPFSEEIKREARTKAHFRCVICKQPFVEVHHIIPQSDGGSDDIENAAPLCAGCHDMFGNDPNKRKQLREMRDQWYGICESRYKDNGTQLIILNTANIYDSTQDLKTGKIDNSSLNRIVQKNLLDILSVVTGEIKVSKNLDDIITTSGYVVIAQIFAMNSEVATVKTTNQAYAAEHQGMFATNSDELSIYLSGTLKARYTMDTRNGAILTADSTIVGGCGTNNDFNLSTQEWQFGTTGKNIT